MKLNRILYLSLLIITFSFVYYYGGKVPNIFFYTVAILPVVSFLHMVAGYFILKYEQKLDKDVVLKGNKVTFKVNIINKSFFSFPYVKVNFLNYKGGVIEKQEIRTIAINPFSKEGVYIDYEYKYRGYFKLGVNDIELQDFLGIFKITRKNKNPLYITVYPEIIDIDEFYLGIGDFSNNMSNMSGVHENESINKEEVQLIIDFYKDIPVNYKKRIGVVKYFIFNNILGI